MTEFENSACIHNYKATPIRFLSRFPVTNTMRACGSLFIINVIIMAFKAYTISHKIAISKESSYIARPIVFFFTGST